MTRIVIQDVICNRKNCEKRVPLENSQSWTVMVTAPPVGADPNQAVEEHLCPECTLEHKAWMNKPRSLIQ